MGKSNSYLLRKALPPQLPQSLAKHGRVTLPGVLLLYRNGKCAKWSTRLLAQPARATKEFWVSGDMGAASCCTGQQDSSVQVRMESV